MGQNNLLVKVIIKEPFKETGSNNHWYLILLVIGCTANNVLAVFVYGVSTGNSHCTGWPK